MLFITLQPQQLQRDHLAYPGEEPQKFFGFSYSATIEENWRANRGIYVLGERAHKEKYVAFVFDREVVLIAEIDNIQPYPDQTHGKKHYYINGTPLTPGQTIYEKMIGRSVITNRNPVRYEQIPEVENWDWQQDTQIAQILNDKQKQYPDYEQFIARLKKM